MNSLELAGISLSYGATQVVANVSFAVAAGEFFVILGPNGAGKSSLLKLVAGIEKADGGEIRVLGKPLSSYSTRDLAKEIAMVSQQAPIDFPFSVAETVLMGRSPHLGLLGLEGEKDFAIAEEAMRFTEVTHLAQRRLDRLSGGERQRVMIARAICQEPKIILLDEPTTALDPAHQVRIMDLMERFRQEKATTVLMVSHDLNMASMYADRLLLLKEGKVVVIGSPGEVITPDWIRKSYDCDLLIDDNPLGGVPRVVPIPAKFKTAGKK